MRWHVAAGLALLLMATPLSAHADAGRAAPDCLTQSRLIAPSVAGHRPGVCVVVTSGC